MLGQNTEHYDLEKRIAERIESIDAAELRDAIIRFMEDASVPTVNSLASYLDVPLKTAAL